MIFKKKTLKQFQIIRETSAKTFVGQVACRTDIDCINT